MMMCPRMMKKVEPMRMGSAWNRLSSHSAMDSISAAEMQPALPRGAGELGGIGGGANG